MHNTHDAHTNDNANDNNYTCQNYIKQATYDICVWPTLLTFPSERPSRARYTEQGPQPLNMAPKKVDTIEKEKQSIQCCVYEFCHYQVRKGNGDLMLDKDDITDILNICEGR